MGAFDYSAKSAQQRVALLVKDSTSDARVITGLVGPKLYAANLTSSVWTRMLSVSGSGAINFAALYYQGAGTGALTLKITIDSRVIYNRQTVAGANGSGQVGVGTLLIDTTNSISNYAIQRIPFEKSLLIEVMSTAGDQIYLAADYEVNV